MGAYCDRIDPTCRRRACFGLAAGLFWNHPVKEPTAKAPARTSRQKHSATRRRLWLDITIAILNRPLRSSKNAFLRSRANRCSGFRQGWVISFRKLRYLEEACTFDKKHFYPARDKACRNCVTDITPFLSEKSNYFLFFGQFIKRVVF